jgi:AcrR family transcriptional regulator
MSARTDDRAGAPGPDAAASGTSAAPAPPAAPGHLPGGGLPSGGGPLSGGEPGTFRQRLLKGLAASIKERGYRETKISDIVRHARTSRRTFYKEFTSKDDCFVALLESTNKRMRSQITAAVDPSAPWRDQVRSAIEAYVEAMASAPELSVSWIRELPALGMTAREVQRDAMESMTQMILQLGDTLELRRAGVGPISRPTAIMLLGGLRELTATIVEDGGDIRDMTDVATEAAIALLGPKQTS